jgi:N-acetylated-alpha-linked acidic dipeptidase
LTNKGVNYNVGPTPDHIVMNLYNNMNYTTGLIHDVVASIPGTEWEDEVVIVGNHRDAWGPGAGDPNSGSSALNEVVRSFGVALKRGWRPLRTIMFVSFEGEEFGQVGSRPWIRENLPWLNRTAVAYLNVIVAASGTQFHVKASPLLRQAVLNATGMVLSPNQTVADQTVLNVWGGHIAPGGGGDASRFLSEACISTLDMGYSPSIDEPVFPYHSQFDTVEWMDAFGDPGWKHHTTTAKIWSLMAAHLVNSPVLAEKVTDYATGLRDYLSITKGKLTPALADFDFTVLDDSITRLHELALRFDAYASSLAHKIPQTRQWWNFWGRARLMSKFREVNQIYIQFERMFYYEPGLDGDTQLKHVLFPMAAWHRNPDALPGLGDSLAQGNVSNAYVRILCLLMLFFLLLTSCFYRNGRVSLLVASIKRAAYLSIISAEDPRLNEIECLEGICGFLRSFYLYHQFSSELSIYNFSIINIP